jgi:hypothetical protein
MNFYFAAIGNKHEVLGQLENSDTRGSILACRVRDLIADAVKTEPEFYKPGHSEFYNISVHGHSGDPTAPFNLNIQIQSRYLPRSE